MGYFVFIIRSLFINVPTRNARENGCKVNTFF